MERENTERVTYRMSKPRLDAVDSLAERCGLSRSELLRRFDAFALEANADALALECEIDQLRDDIIADGRPVDMGGGFGKRVKDDFEKRFKNGYEPKWLLAKSESYFEEARMLEDKLPQHPDSPHIEPGEFVEIVERVLSDVLDAAEMSDWTNRYDNEFEHIEGVESGAQKRKLALALTRTAMKIDRDYLTLCDHLQSTDRRVRADDLPNTPADELPSGVTLDDVAELAQHLNEQGADPDNLDTDPWQSVSGALDDGTDATAQLDNRRADGGQPTRALPDGGETQIVAVEQNQPVEPGMNGSGTTQHMGLKEHNRDEATLSAGEMIDELAELAARLGPDNPATRHLIGKRINSNTGKRRYVRRIKWDGLDTAAVIDEAITKAKEVGQ